MYKPLSPLDYTELYKIAEELAQLAHARASLQNAVGEGSERYHLQFYAELHGGGGSRWVTIDLKPARPFILSTGSTLPKKKSKPTPVQNFLQAHFKGLELLSVEMAQKPNRTLRMVFGNESVLEFHCFPHGQKLILTSQGKRVVYPPHGPPHGPPPGPQKGRQTESSGSKEVLCFVEVEPSVSPGWNFNQELSAYFGLGISKAPDEGASLTQPPQNKQLQKLERALQKMEEKREEFLKNTEEKIVVLEAQARDIKNSGSVGNRLEKIYAEIKKLKRGILEFGERKNRLENQIKNISAIPPTPFSGEIQQAGSESHGTKFAGTKIIIDPRWQLWVGRKALQNDELLRLGSPHDLWIHMRDYAGAHGLLRGPRGKEPDLKILEFSCRVVALFTQNKKKPFQEGEVLEFIVTPKKFVKKKKGLGPGKVIVERESIRRVAFKEVDFLSA